MAQINLYTYVHSMSKYKQHSPQVAEGAPTEIKSIIMNMSEEVKRCETENQELALSNSY